MKYRLFTIYCDTQSDMIIESDHIADLVEAGRYLYKSAMVDLVAVSERGRANIWTVADGYNKFKKLRKYKGLK